MAKLTAIKGTKANGDKIIAGYRVALPKVAMERYGFKEGDNLRVTIKRNEVRIVKK